MANAPSTDTAFFGHPRGLSTLFFTEMWERFSYYGMRALLLLYVTAPVAAGGLGLQRRGGRRDLRALHVDGLHGGAAGRLDRRPAASASAAPCCGAASSSPRGHFTAAIPALATFYLGLTLIVVGTGLLKGNVSA